MPRPKVRPQDRQRSVRACRSCKAAKIRCSGDAPCIACVKRGKDNDCTFAPISSVRKPRRRVRTTSATSLPQMSCSDHTSNVSHDDSVNARSAVLSPAPVTPQDDQADDYMESTESRLLYSSKGEKVFIGETASLSFLHFVRVVVGRQLGPCAFTETAFREFMLEVDTPSASNNVFNEPSLLEQRLLIKAYREAASGFLDLHTPEELTQMEAEVHDIARRADKVARDHYAIRCAMLAIGAQARGQASDDLIHASHYFKIAQTRAFEDMLCNPSIDMVRLFLLMAFYMLGACHRNAGFMYLGVASKAACALGLHKEEQSLGLPAEERGARSRCWRSLRTLDSVVNLILGRPNCLPPTLSKGPERMSLKYATSDDLPNLACRAILDLCSIVDGLDLKSRKGCAAEVDEAIRLLSRTKSWTADLPEQLQRGLNENLLRSTNCDGVIAALHVACAYYFTIILISRPFMVTYFTRSMSNTGIARQTNPRVSELAQTCLDSAMYLANAGHTVLASSKLIGNMCILKAWMFLAGLLIGFAMFSQPDSSLDLRQSFDNARSVLVYLRACSPQAALYSEILTSLSEAIVARQEQVLARRRTVTNQYVQPLFSLGLNGQNLRGNVSPNGLVQGLGQGGREFTQQVSDTSQQTADGADILDTWPGVATMPMLWDDIDFDWNQLDLTFPT